jgi:hypothetical protein
MTILSGTAIAYAANIGTTVTPSFNTGSVTMANMVATGFTITTGQGSRLGNGFIVGFTGCEL